MSARCLIEADIVSSPAAEAQLDQGAQRCLRCMQFARCLPSVPASTARALRNLH